MRAFAVTHDSPRCPSLADFGYPPRQPLHLARRQPLNESSPGNDVTAYCNAFAWPATQWLLTWERRDVTDPGVAVHVGGDMRGQIVVGDNNLAVWAEQSVVTVLSGPRPKPSRRDQVLLLPRRSSPPIGRERDVDAVLRAAGDDRLVQIYGPPGSGKSTLLRHVCGATGNDPAVFLPAAGRDVSDLLQDVFEACYDTEGYRPSPVELRRFMEGIDLRLWLDDLDVTAEERDTLLDGVPDASVVFTSADRAVWTNGRSLRLDGLDAESGLALLVRALGRPLNDREQRTAMDLWRAGAGSPLALLRAAAAARPGDDGQGVLPRPGELADLLPRLVSALSPAAQDVAAILLLGGPAGVSANLLPRLVTEAAGVPGVLEELCRLGLVLDMGALFQLAPGVEAALPAADSARLTGIATALREWAGSAPPPEVAAHTSLITAVVDATVPAGHPELGAALAKSAAPAVACSMRLGAWGRILGRGKVAAEHARDQSVLAYFTHEDGVLSLITGKRAAAVAAIGAAVAIWHKLGATTHLALAEHTQAAAGHAIAHLGAATAPGQVLAPVAGGGQAIAGAAKTAGVGAKAGAGLATKLAVAGAATAIVGGGGYFAVSAVLPDHPSPPAVSVVAAPPQLTSEQLAQALLPGQGFPAGYNVIPQCQAGCAAPSTPPLSTADLATMTCTDPLPPHRPLFPVGFASAGFPAGFGATAFAGDEQVGTEAGNSHSVGVDDNVIFNQAIYQFATPAAASGFFDGVHKVLTTCTDDSTDKPTAATSTVDGHPAIIADPIVLERATPAVGNIDFYSTMAPYYVLDGSYVYALAPGTGRNIDRAPLATMVPNLPSLATKLIANVARLTGQAPPGGATPATTTPASGPEGVVRAYIAAINAKDYATAWALGGKNFGQNFDAFKAGFDGTDHDDLTVAAVDGGQVTVDLIATQTDHSQRRYHGTYTVTGDTITGRDIH